MHTLRGIYDTLYNFLHLEQCYFLCRLNKRFRNDYLHFEKYRNINLTNLSIALQTETFHLGPYMYQTIFDPKERMIMMLDVPDRIVQQAWYQLVNPFIDSRLYYYSFATRKNKGVHKMTKIIHDFIYGQRIIENKKLWVAKCDIHKFFPSIDHEILKRLFNKYVADKRIQKLTNHFIEWNGKYLPDGKGIPIGTLPSQLFANLYADPLDNFVLDLCHQYGFPLYIRYMDDSLIFGYDYHSLQNVIYIINEFINKELHLSLNPKSDVLYIDNGFDFVGFRHFPNRTIPRKRNIKNLFKLVKRYKEDPNYTFEEFSKAFISSRGYILSVDSYNILNSIDREYNELLMAEKLGKEENINKVKVL